MGVVLRKTLLSTSLLVTVVLLLIRKGYLDLTRFGVGYYGYIYTIEDEIKERPLSCLGPFKTATEAIEAAVDKEAVGISLGFLWRKPAVG